MRGTKRVGPLPECAVPGCVTVSKTSGLCGMHYQRKRQGRPMDAPVRPFTDCETHKTCLKCGEPKTGSHRSYCRRCSNEYRRAHTAGELAPIQARNCDGCGVLYMPQARLRSKYCTRKCKDNAKDARVAKQLLAVKAQQPRTCPHCGNAVPVSNRAKSKFCSAACSKEAHHLNKNLGRLGFVRAQIGERDNWTCRICRKPVDRSVRYPDSRSASLDHIIPVSRGGKHTFENLRISHLGCNIVRGNRYDIAELGVATTEPRPVTLSLFDFAEFTLEDA